MLTQLVLLHKIGAIQKELKDKRVESLGPLHSLDDYLIISNEIALNYFDEHVGSRKPICVSYALYTYSAFLLAAKYNSMQNLQEHVRCVGGLYVFGGEAGTHLWLGKKEGSSWEIFETVPTMRPLSAKYIPWFTFQITPEAKIITYEEVFNLLSMLVAGIQRQYKVNSKKSRSSPIRAQ